MDAHYRQNFPSLANVAAKKTSEADDRYNCIAWAFGDNGNRWWWPSPRCYWPLNPAGKSVAEAFADWFQADGWEETPSEVVEVGYQKVALFALNGKPTHGARLLPNGLWTSKLGADIDLSHALSDLVGPKYGEVHKIYRKRV